MFSFKKILLVQTGFLGDLVLSTPVLAALRDLYPSASIDVLCTKQAAVFLKSHPQVSEVLEFDKRGRDSGLKGLFRKAKELRQRKYDAVFSLHKSYRTASLLFLAGIPMRFGFKEASLSFLYTKTSPRKDLPHEVMRNLAVLRSCGVDPEKLNYPLFLACTKEQEEEGMQHVQEIKKPYVVIAPGSVWRTKRWTKEGFADLAQKLIDSGKGVVILGGPDDADSGRYIEEQLLQKKCEQGKDFLNLVGKISLIISTAIIKGSECVITNDSAPLHIASAVETPVVAVFCATVPAFGFTPWLVPHRIVEKKGLSCRPCGAHGGNVCPVGTDACQKEISADQVFSEMRSLYAELGLQV